MSDYAVIPPDAAILPEYQYVLRWENGSDHPLLFRMAIVAGEDLSLLHAWEMLPPAVKERGLVIETRNGSSAGNSGSQQTGPLSSLRGSLVAKAACVPLRLGSDLISVLEEECGRVGKSRNHFHCITSWLWMNSGHWRLCMDEQK